MAYIDLAAANSPVGEFNYTLYKTPYMDYMTVVQHCSTAHNHCDSRRCNAHCAGLLDRTGIIDMEG